MTVALLVLLLQGVMGAFDTLYYHEWRARLPSRPNARLELRLHATRDMIYAVIFGTLAWFTCHGLWTWLLGALLTAEIIITLWDFLEEDRTRRLDPGERISHVLMAIIFGSFLTLLMPHAITWSAQPSELVRTDHGWISGVMSLMAVGVFLSGIRDYVAAAGLFNGPLAPRVPSPVP